jgi:hypothetical protein
MATKKASSQLEKFKQAARQLEADDSERRFDERLERIARQKPMPTQSKAAKKKLKK